MEIIGVIIAGVIIGLLGKFFAPGDRDDIPIWLTVLCAIGGVRSATTPPPPSESRRPTGSTGSVGSSASPSLPSWS